MNLLTLNVVPPCRRRLLSEAIGALTPEQLAQMERDAAGYPLKLIDVSPNVDVASYLSRWHGSFTVSDLADKL